MKKKSIIWVIVALLAVLVIVLIWLLSCKDNNGGNGETTTVSSEQTSGSEEVTLESITEEVDSETNFFENVDFVEDANETEIVTDEEGNIVEEEYPGQHSGWSPIVPADEVGN